MEPHFFKKSQRPPAKQSVYTLPKRAVCTSTLFLLESMLDGPLSVITAVISHHLIGRPESGLRRSYSQPRKVRL